MYKQHFSFKHKPFELIPNPEFLFRSSTHNKAITFLDYGVQEKIGFILITGEIGSGKTTIVRNLIKSLNGSVKLSKINNTKVSSEQLIYMINEDFGLDVEGKNKTKLLSELNDFLIEQYSKKIQPILLIDEAQNLSSDLLEEIRLLSNLETDEAKLVQIILIGQPELKKTLMLTELRQLRQRININYHISPLTIDETLGYIRHRIKVAGNGNAINFQGNMLNLIFQFSRGIPRLINILCDFALLLAFVDGEKVVNIDVIEQVVKDLESHDYWNESQDNSDIKMSNNKDNLDLFETAGNFALRLIKLEEELKVGLSEIKSLSDNVNNLEKMVSQIKKSGQNDRVNESLQRLEEKLACRILVKIAEDNKIPELLDRISRLEETLNSVNRQQQISENNENVKHRENN